MEKFILTIDGPSGVVKTSIGKHLADILKCNFFCHDLVEFGIIIG